jgi:hypothetical protein
MANGRGMVGRGGEECGRHDQYRTESSENQVAHRVAPLGRQSAGDGRGLFLSAQPRLKDERKVPGRHARKWANSLNWMA